MVSKNSLFVALTVLSFSTIVAEQNENVKYIPFSEDSKKGYIAKRMDNRQVHAYLCGHQREFRKCAKMDAQCLGNVPAWVGSLFVEVGAFEAWVVRVNQDMPQETIAEQKETPADITAVEQKVELVKTDSPRMEDEVLDTEQKQEDEK